MKLIVVLSIVCITLFALLGLYLITTQKGTKTANRLLGSFFILWSLDLLDGLLLLQGYQLKHPHFALWTEPFFLLYGPLLFFYTRLSLGNERLPGVRTLIHFIPFILGLLLLLFSFHLRPVSEKLQILTAITDFDQPVESLLIAPLIYVHFAIYLWKSKKRIGTAKKQLVNFYSHFNITWLDKLLNLMILILVLSILIGIVQHISGQKYYETALIGVLILIGIFISTIIFKALDRPFLATPVTSKKEHPIASQEIETILHSITDSLERKRLFLKPELSLKDLSEAVGHPSRKVSQVINDQMNQSFFDLVNGYRIEEAKKIFKENNDPKLTVLEVMYEVGFNSKSSFNTQFKKKTGRTPSAFLKGNS